MMKQPTVRHARAAIAAVLAFASTPLLAQVAASSGPPPIAPTQVAPAPVVAAPVAVAPAPVMAAPAPVVQPTPAPIPVVAEVAPEVGPTPRSASSRTNPVRSAPTRAEIVAQRSPAPTVTEPTKTVEATAVAPAAAAPEVVQNTAPETSATPAPIASATGDSNGLEWGLAGGAVVLLGGLSLMALRRRRRPEQEEVLLTERAPVAEAAPTYTPAPAAPIHVAPPRDRSVMAPVIARTGAHGSLEALAAELPSPANPFLTRKNRLRRAHFMLRQQDGGSAVPEALVAAKPAQVQEQRRASPVYDFGGGMTQRRGFRPATT